MMEDFSPIVSDSKKEPLVSMKKISKFFGMVQVLDDVDFDIYSGEVHLLTGENGAGKSTLIKILSGVYTPNQGEILLDGKSITPANPLEANNLGISVIHQELSIIPQMTVKENLSLGCLKTRFGFLSEKSIEATASRILEDLGISIDLNVRAEDISISRQQLIEIAKATSMNSRVIVMDEPSSALSIKDAEILFELIDSLKVKGVGIVYITHRMEEIERLADRVTVLRDGRFISTGLISEYSSKRLVKDMVGRELDEKFTRKKADIGDTILELKNLSLQKSGSNPVFEEISLSLHEGEIVGLGGLQGSGASELLSAIFGVYGNRVQGRILVKGKSYKNLSPRNSIDRRMGFITNDRKGNGLILPMSIIQNITMASISEFTSAGILNEKQEAESARQSQKELSIRAAQLDMEVRMLSGGNQQKVVLGKWILGKPEILLMDEPTRGVDVGAKWDIYKLLEDLTRKGVAILLITSELSELMSLSDRILVMHRGRVVQELQPNEYDGEHIISTAMGLDLRELV